MEKKYSQVSKSNHVLSIRVELLHPYIPLGYERKRTIGAVSDANLDEKLTATIDDRSEHTINSPLEQGGPPASRLGDRVEMRLEVKDRVETGGV